MPRACTVCTHPDRLAIEATLQAGTPLRTTAARWSVSKTALLRHLNRHGSPQAHMDQAVPLVALPTAVPHTLPGCAAALLAHCPPEVRERFEEAAPRLAWTLDVMVATALSEYVRHVDQCPHSPQGRSDRRGWHRGGLQEKIRQKTPRIGLSQETCTLLAAPSLFASHFPGGAVESALPFSYNQTL